MRNCFSFLLLWLATLPLNAEHQKIHIVFTVPRTVSTAFEKSMMARGDHKVFHEPWHQCILYEKGWLQHKPQQELVDAKNYEGMKALAYRYAENKPVFIKDMVWCIADELIRDEAFLADPDVSLSLLLRDPALSMESFFTILSQNMPMERVAMSIMPMIFRYDALVRLAEKYHEIRGEWPFIIHSEDLCAKPHEVMQAYCKRVGISFIPEALSWQSGEPEEWQHTGSSWHTAASHSTGFFSPKKSAEGVRFASIPAPYASSLEELYRAQKPFYDLLMNMQKIQR